MTETFTAGEEVTFTMEDARVKVEFGPFAGIYSDGAEATRYLVRFLTGRHAGRTGSAPAKYLIRGPKYAEGDAVQVGSLRTPATIAAGPFRTRAEVDFYVLKFASGHHETRSDTGLYPAPEPAQTFTLDGIQYDLTVNYEDREGDVWRFNGQSRNGQPLMVLIETGAVSRLGSVVTEYGPIHKRS